MDRRGDPPASDRELLVGCLNGDQLAWDTLIDRYAALLYSIPLKYGLAPDDAADVFQSVCVTLVERLGAVREPDRLAGWIVTTASRECLALLRRQRRELSRPATSRCSSHTREPADTRLLPEDELLALERQHLVRSAVNHLADPCRRLIRALFSDSLERPSYHQLASGLGVPVNSLGPTRARCLEKLRRALQSDGYFTL